MSDFEQLSLFAPHVEHGRAAETLALALDFRRALAAAKAAGAMAGPLVGLLEALLAVKGGRGKLSWFQESLARTRVAGLDLIPGLEARLCGEAAQALEAAQGVGARWEDVSSAGLWARAGEPDKAIAALSATAEREGTGPSWVHVANALAAHGNAAGAREALGRAFFVDPLGVDGTTIRDTRVQDLLDTTADLVPDEDGESQLWVLAVGLADGVFLPAWGKDVVVPHVIAAVSTPAERARAAGALLLHAHHDRDPIPARRALKELAPWLLRRVVR